MRATPAIAGVTIVGACMVGCSLFVRLDGLAGGACTDCADGGASSNVLDASPVDAADPSDAPVATAVDSGGSTDAGGGDAATQDAAVCTPPTPANLDDCAALASMSADPVIDGTLECGVALWSMPVVVSSGPGQLPGSVRANVGAAWRGNGLYFFVEVSGAGASRYPAPSGSDGAWCGDAVELFVDSNGTYASPPLYDDPGTIQLIAGSPPDTAPTSTTGGEAYRDGIDAGAWTGTFVTTRTGDGFTLEAFVAAGDLGLSKWSLVAGKRVGLDVAVDLGDPSKPAGTCPRLGQFTIQLPEVSTGACSGPACDVNEFCNPQLN